MMRKWSIAAGLCAVALFGCARERPIANPAPEYAPAPPRQAQRAAPTAAAYVATAGSIDLLAVRSSELALDRSRSPRVRALAALLIDDHKGDAGRLSLAGRRLNLLPSATLLARHQRMLDRLQGASDFDAAYRNTLLQAEQEALALDRSYSAAGQSPTLRLVAAAAIPAIERHLSLIGNL